MVSCGQKWLNFRLFCQKMRLKKTFYDEEWDKRRPDFVFFCFDWGFKKKRFTKTISPKCAFFCSFFVFLKSILLWFSCVEKKWLCRNRDLKKNVLRWCRGQKWSNLRHFSDSPGVIYEENIVIKGGILCVFCDLKKNVSRLRYRQNVLFFAHFLCFWNRFCFDFPAWKKTGCFDFFAW